MRSRLLLTGVIPLVFIVFVISLASAEIIISQPSKFTYNVGEQLKISVSVLQGGSALEANLICENSSESKLVFFKNLEASEKKVEISQPLTKSFLGNMNGDCHIITKYNGETEKSQIFKISNRIDIALSVSRSNYNAGEQVKVSGEATKGNSEPVNGFVEITLENTDIKIIKEFKNSKFSANFTLMDNIAAGSYYVNAYVYEKTSDGQISNQGSSTAVIRVNQEIKKLEIAINDQAISPGNDISFKVLLYDQANYEVPGDTTVSVKDSDEKELLKRLVKTNEEIILPIATNASSGYWKIEASSMGIKGDRLFFVEEDEKASFEIINDTLIIINIGNVIYRKAVQIAIGSDVEIKEMDLDIGESKRFRLLAPDGDYQISVTDGAETFSQSGVSLTGNAIGVQDIRKQLSIWSKYPIVWIFLILVMGLFAMLLFQRTIKKRAYAYPVEEKKEKHGQGILRTIGINKGEKDISSSKAQRAEHSLVLNGEKQEVGIICLKIKNKLEKQAELNLKQAFSQAYEVKAVDYKSGDFVFLIFSPMITRKTRNQTDTIRTAISLAKALEEHNHKFKDKIEFGIAVHTGNLINKLENGVLKFTGVGNTLGIAKRLAEVSKGEVLLSKEIHEKTISEVKADKVTKEGFEVFTVNKIVEGEKNRKFVQDFLKRLDEQGKGK